eukprot:TRINITY_DN10062_c1_g1_i5.p1 TRINITY_DN10062_c1_g1~~TRINITY_DN10062_c1_g1_i5.p1  ORF type:complete len:296 (+),score=20.34 TRINITY_DN10062_c1_g1_i5:178-1065(+)
MKNSKLLTLVVSNLKCTVWQPRVCGYISNKGGVWQQVEPFCSLPLASQSQFLNKQVISQLLQNQEWTKQQWVEIRENKQIQINLLQEFLQLEEYSMKVDNLCRILLHDNGGSLSGSDVAMLTYLCCNTSKLAGKRHRLLEGLSFFTNKMAYDFTPKQLAMILQAHAAVQFQHQLLHKRLANAAIYRMSEIQLEDMARILGSLGDLRIDCSLLQEIVIEWSQYQVQDTTLLSGESLVEFLWGILWNQYSTVNIPWLADVISRLPTQFDNQQNTSRLQQVVDKLQELGLNSRSNKLQ